MVKVVPLDAPPARKVKRFDFLAGQIEVPDDFDTMFADEIEKMFYGDEVKLLLDTHLLLWTVSQSRRLSSKARELIADPDNELLVQYGEPVGGRR